MDIDWNFHDEWSLMSASEDSDSIVMHDEGSLQLYRPLDLLVGNKEGTILYEDMNMTVEGQ